MKQFTFLYVGGNPGPEHQEENMKDWMMWIQELGDAYKGGSAYEMKHMSVTADGESEMMMDDNSVSGHSDIHAESMEAAVALSKGCPNLKHGGKVLVQENMDLNM